MNFSKAYKRLLNGKKVRRIDWIDGCYITVDKNQKFITLNTSDGYSKRWSPYWIDFNSNDWIELDKKSWWFR